MKSADELLIFLNLINFIKFLITPNAIDLCWLNIIYNPVDKQDAVCI